MAAPDWLAHTAWSTGAARGSVDQGGATWRPWIGGSRKRGRRAGGAICGGRRAGGATCMGRRAGGRRTRGRHMAAHDCRPPPASLSWSGHAAWPDWPHTRCLLFGTRIAPRTIQAMRILGWCLCFRRPNVSCAQNFTSKPDFWAFWVLPINRHFLSLISFFLGGVIRVGFLAELLHLVFFSSKDCEDFWRPQHR